MAVALHGAGRPYNERTPNGSPAPAAPALAATRPPSIRPWNSVRPRVPSAAG